MIDEIGTWSSAFGTGAGNWAEKFVSSCSRSNTGVSNFREVRVAEVMAQPTNTFYGAAAMAYQDRVEALLTFFATSR
jgi:hypothetical protein